MKRSLILSLLALSLTVLATGLTPGSGARAAVETTTTIDDDLFDLKFSGGTAAQYIEAILEQNSDVNIIISPEAGGLRLPRIDLKSVSLDMALWLLDGKVYISGANEIEVFVDQNPGNPNIGSLSIYNISARGLTTPRKTFVLAVDQILGDDLGPNDLLTAIEASLDMISEEYPAAKISFHSETGILLVRAHPEQIELIENLMAELFRASEVKFTMESRQKMEERRETEREAAMYAEAKQQAVESTIKMAEWQSRFEAISDSYNRLNGMIKQYERTNQSLQERNIALQVEIAKLKQNK